MNTKDLGFFLVKSGALAVSDPCYDNPNTVGNVKNGAWTASVDFEDGCVSALKVCHKDHTADFLEFKECDLRIDVDSGQAGIFDADFFGDDEELDQGDTQHKSEGRPWGIGQTDFYDVCCNLTSSEARAGCLSRGVVSNSGYGDGAYTCYKAEVGDQVVALMVIFIDDAVDEEELI